MVLTHDRPTTGFDVSLVRRACAGDYEAFAALMERHAAPVRRLVRRFVRDDDDASDVEQDTWIRAANKLGSLSDGERFQPWVKMIARNASLDYLSSRKRRGAQVTTFEALGTEDFEDTASPTPEAAVLSKDSQRKVWQALGTLSDRDRTALFLREYKGLPYADIAAELGVSRNAAEVCAHRARERFRVAFTAVDADIPECGVDGLRLSTLLEPAERTPLAARLDLESHAEACCDCQRRLAAMDEGRTLYRNLGAFGFPIPGAGLFGWAGDLLAKLGHLLGLTASGGATTVGTGATAAGVTATTGAVTTAAAIGGAVSATTIATATAAVILVGAVIPSLLVPSDAAATAAPTPSAISSAVIGGTLSTDDVVPGPAARRADREPHEDPPGIGRPTAAPVVSRPIVTPDDDGGPAVSPSRIQDETPIPPVTSQAGVPTPSSEEPAPPPPADAETGPPAGQGPSAHSEGSVNRSNADATSGHTVALGVMTLGSPGKGPQGNGPPGHASAAIGSGSGGPPLQASAAIGIGSGGPPVQGAAANGLGSGSPPAQAPAATGARSGGPPVQASAATGAGSGGPPVQAPAATGLSSGGPPVQVSAANGVGSGGPPAQVVQGRGPMGRGARD